MRLRPEFVRFMVVFVPIIVLASMVLCAAGGVYLGRSLIWAGMSGLAQIAIDLMLIAFVVLAPFAMIMGGLFGVATFVRSYVIVSKIPDDIFAEGFRKGSLLMAVMVSVFVILPELFFNFAMKMKLENTIERFVNSADCEGMYVKVDMSVLKERDAILKESGAVMLGIWRASDPGGDERDLSTSGTYIWVPFQ